MPYPYSNPLVGSSAPQTISRPQLSYSDFKGHSKDYFLGIHVGYVAGGATSATTKSSSVQRYNFVSQGSGFSAAVATLTRAAKDTAGASAYRYTGFTNYGLTAGGDDSPGTGTSISNIVDRFPFSSEGSATDVGDLTVARRFLAGLSSWFKGFFSGGNASGTTYSSTIDSIPYSSIGNATSVGNLTSGRYSVAGCSSESIGYSCGGITAPPDIGYNIIDRFPFATTASATNVGDLTTNDTGRVGISGTSRGYVAGSFNSTSPTIPSSSRIQSFPFSNDNNANDVGTLSVVRADAAGFSSIDSAFVAGGRFPSAPAYYNVVDKFPFSATSGTASDVGDLSIAKASAAGLQN